jgi:hypothetical protein
LKAIIEFNLPEDREDFEAAIAGGKSKMLIDTLYDDVFRVMIKYSTFEGEELDDKSYKLVEDIWQKVYAHFYEED